MIDPELVAKIRLLFFAEHWKIGTIATQLNLHRDTVRAALETDRFNRPQQDRARRKTDPYVDFIRQTLAQYPRLRSTRIFQMIRARGYEGGSSQLRRLVARLRPVLQEPFLQLRTFPGEQGQADWARLWRSSHRASPPSSLLLCHYPFLLSRPGSELLFRSEFGKFAARPRRGLPAVSGFSAHHPLRQHAQCGFRALPEPSAVASPSVGTGGALSLRGPSLSSGSWE